MLVLAGRGTQTGGGGSRLGGGGAGSETGDGRGARPSPEMIPPICGRSAGLGGSGGGGDRPS